MKKYVIFEILVSRENEASHMPMLLVFLLDTTHSSSSMSFSEINSFIFFRNSPAPLALTFICLSPRARGTSFSLQLKTFPTRKILQASVEAFRQIDFVKSRICGVISKSGRRKFGQIP